MAYTKVCKYCDLVKITWDDTQGKYVEVDSKEHHTKERCQDAQSKGGAPKPAKQGYFKTGQDQKSEDIKAAQLERKKQHVELIKNMQVLTRAIGKLIQHNGGPTEPEILDQIGFEQYREDQQSFQDEVV